MGRKGFVKELKEYWDVATYFEMAVLESLHGHSAAYDTAVVAASRMYFFNSPSWHLRSTLKNIRLIRCRYHSNNDEKHSIRKYSHHWVLRLGV